MACGAVVTVALSFPDEGSRDRGGRCHTDYGFPSGVFVTSLPVALPPFAKPRSRTLRAVRRWALMIGGLLIVLLGILIAPLPGPGGVPVIAVGLVLILKSSFWAKRQFIRAQYARPKWGLSLPPFDAKEARVRARLLATGAAGREGGRQTVRSSPVARPQTAASLFPQVGPLVDVYLAVALLQPLTTAS